MSENERKVGRSMKAAGGLIALTGGAILAGVGSAAPAFASASGCTGMPTGLQCLEVHGNGQAVNTAYESASRIASPGEICDFNAKWYGDNVTTGWTTYTHAEVKACWIQDAYIYWTYGTRNFKKDTDFYGYWESRASSGWSNPVKEEIK
jgi:hypothetical protein